MYFDANTTTFAVAAFFVTITPGNDTVLTLRNAMCGGPRDGIFTALGIGSGLFVHALLSALGLSVILLASAELFLAVKFVGAVYVIWLGAKSLIAALRGNGEQLSGMQDECLAPRSSRKRFREGFLCNVLNPKVAIFYLAFLPQFITPGDPVATKSLLLAGIHCVMGVTWLAGISMGVGRARRFVTRPFFRRAIDGVCGTILIGLGLRLAVQER
ncbi:MAG: LysE family translocator [Proteobacteria bacterium]|nr:LysE family translocator [Pseudomonadota bacterium]MBU1611768.1 LysE family translocator [Pseudomonadota bacterium]